MAEHTLHSIVLRRRNTGETDRRLTILTEELGKIDVVAKGARKAASRLAGASDPLSWSIMSVADGKLNRFITQSQPVSSFPKLRTDYDRLCLAMALLELFSAVLPYEQPLPELYELLIECLRHLEAHPKPLVAAIWSQVRLLDESGFFPELDACAVTGEAILDAESYLSPQAGGFVSASAALRFTDRYRVRAEVIYGLSRIRQLPKPPANLKFAEETLAALLPFWRQVADLALPANESVVAEIRHLSGSNAEVR